MNDPRTAIDTNALEAVYEAFVSGRDRPKSTEFAAPGRLFAELLNAQTRGRLPEAERTVVESCWGGHYRGIVAARKEHLEQSRQELEAVRVVLRTSSLSAEASLLIQVLLDPAEAYLHFKLNDYERARELVLSGAALNHRLAEEFGYGIISAQRMQLCHNILRVNSRQGKRAETVRLAAAFLDYLEFDENRLPPEIAWAWIVRDAVPDSIVRYYFDQVCGEAALALAGSNEAALFQPLGRHADPGRCPGGFSGHAHAWVAAKLTMLEGDLANYLGRACELLRLGRAAELSLWFATILDVISACRSLGHEGVKMAEQLSEAASQIHDAPWLFRPSVVHP